MCLKLGTYKNARNKIEIVKIYSISNRKFINYKKTTCYGVVYGGEGFHAKEFEDFLKLFNYKYTGEGNWD